MKELQAILPTWMSSEGEYQDVVLFTKMSLNRNLEEFPFPNALDPALLPQLLSQGTAAARQIYENPQGCDLSEDGAAILAEQCYINKNMMGMGRYISISSDGNSAILINAEDHFSFMEFGAGFTPQAQLKKLAERDERLEQDFNYAVSMDMGYLLSQLDRVGSGLHVDICLHLPILSVQEEFRKIIARAGRNGLSIRGFGNTQSPLGQLFQLSGDAIFGHSEEETLEKITPIVQELVYMERAERNKLRQSLQVIDALWRNLAILQNCRLLALPESLNRFSNVRLGTALGILPPPATISPFFFSQPAHLDKIATLPEFSNHHSPHHNNEPNNMDLRATLFRRLLA